MIIASLQNSTRVEGLHPKFKQLFDYIKTHDLLHAPLGRIELDGDNLFINNSESECVSADEQLLEMHRAYIDVHVPLDRAETIGWRTIETMTHITQPYQQEKDCAFSDDKPTMYAVLQPGEFALIYPEDLHAPIIGEGKIRKLVGKIKL